jgi:transcriptional regulator with XRE-family HTH domain
MNMINTLIDQYIIDVIREKRKEKNLTQDDLADLLGVSKGFIGRYLHF